MRRLLVASLVALVLAGFMVPRSVEAQNNAAAFCYLNPGAFLGPIQASATGFLWSLNCAYTNGVSRTVVSDIEAQTLSADTLATIAQKLANAVKADGATRGYTVASVLLPQVVSVTPQ